MLKVTSGGLRRLVVGAAAFATAVSSWSAAPAAAYAQDADPVAEAAGSALSLRDEERAALDHLIVTVRHTGRGTDGTYELYCRPGGGSHPDVRGACWVVDRRTRWGQDPFAPAAPGDVCTTQYGGPATAHITGTWAGRPVDATYGRSDGCEVARWDRLVPLLPDLRA